MPSRRQREHRSATQTHPNFANHMQITCTSKLCKSLTSSTETAPRSLRLLRSSSTPQNLQMQPASTPLCWQIACHTHTPSSHPERHPSGYSRCLLRQKSAVHSLLGYLSAGGQPQACAMSLQRRRCVHCREQSAPLQTCDSTPSAPMLLWLRSSHWMDFRCARWGPRNFTPSAIM